MPEQAGGTLRFFSFSDWSFRKKDVYYGKSPKNRGRSVSKMKVLFVCTGNTCRSAMCEAYFNSLSRKNGTEERLSARSAGTDAWDGEESSPFTRTALAPYHTDIADHSARRLTRKMLEESDLIVPMTASHRERILRLLPEAADRVRLLGEFREGGVRDVSDPYGGTAEIYSLCFADMKGPLDRMYLELSKKTPKTGVK